MVKAARIGRGDRARHESEYEAQVFEYTLLPDDFFQMLFLVQSINLDSGEITP